MSIPRVVLAAATALGPVCAEALPQLPSQKLLPSDGAKFDGFGNSISVSGDYAIIGAEKDDDNGTESGSAYLFERQANGTWAQVQKVLPSDGATDDSFGFTSSISGTYAIVGAFRDEDHGNHTGSAYIFERQPSGAWIQKQKLIASDPASGDSFGYNVSMSGDRAIIGAFADTDNGVESGSAYVFERQANGVWQETQKLIASDGAAFERFGFSVSVSGDRALVGAWADDDKGPHSGSAYVFERQANGTWLEVEKLLASGAFTLFGWSVSISGERALIGAEGAGNGSTTSGAAFLFERQANGKWLPIHKLLASDGANNDSFGFAVSIAEEHAVVGAYRADGPGTNYGSAYIFERQSNGVWIETHKLIATDGDNFDNFGTFAAITDSHAFISSSSDDDNGENSGSAHVFDLQDCALNIGFQGPGNIDISICGDDLTLPASNAMFRIDNAVSNSVVMLFGGLVNNPTAVPATLGTLVPIPVLPGFPLILPVGPSGSINFGVTGGPLFPTTVYLQVIANNGSLVQFSNAIKLTIGT